jgi:hypothetical protein
MVQAIVSTFRAYLDVWSSMNVLETLTASLDDDMLVLESRMVSARPVKILVQEMRALRRPPSMAEPAGDQDHNQVSAITSVDASFVLNVIRRLHRISSPAKFLQSQRLARQLNLATSMACRSFSRFIMVLEQVGPRSSGRT